MALIGTAYMMLTWPIQVAQIEPEHGEANAWSCEGGRDGAWVKCEVLGWEGEE